jgi:hypothetical protein
MIMNRDHSFPYTPSKFVLRRNPITPAKGTSLAPVGTTKEFSYGRGLILETIS